MAKNMEKVIYRKKVLNFQILESSKEYYREVLKQKTHYPDFWIDKVLEDIYSYNKNILFEIQELPNGLIAKDETPYKIIDYLIMLKIDYSIFEKMYFEVKIFNYKNHEDIEAN